MTVNPSGLRIEPSAEILSAARAWLNSVRPALAPDFLAACLTGSVLNQGFDIEQSGINVLVVSRSLDSARHGRYLGQRDAVAGEPCRNQGAARVGRGRLARA